MSLCDHREFIAGNVNTDFIAEHNDELFEFNKRTEVDDETVCCSLSTILNHERDLVKQKLPGEKLVHEVKNGFEFFWIH